MLQKYFKNTYIISKWTKQAEELLQVKASSKE